MIPKVKQWTYINNNFVIPLTKLREEIINFSLINNKEYSQYYIKTVKNAEIIADNLHDTIRIKIKNQFPLTYKNCHYKDLGEFMKDNQIELFRLKYLELNFKPIKKGLTKDENDLIGFFNYLVQDVEKYSQIYFKLNS